MQPSVCPVGTETSGLSGKQLGWRIISRLNLLPRLHEITLILEPAEGLLPGSAHSHSSSPLWNPM